ncbi:MAG: amidase [Nannocystaceae bacterium]|nr:amidase [Nannocystaceae bacterium]
MKTQEYLQHDACALSDLVRAGEVTADALLDRAIAQIDRHNGQVNAVVRRLYDRARAAIAAGLPEGPLRGVPILIKDLGADIAGIPTTGGCRLTASRVPDQDSEVVRRYERAGAVIVGKTNTPELGITGVTESELLGPARNPWALDRTPGGSSGGSAAAVALRMTPIAHAGDGGGSIRIPASCTGLVGLKPSRGRVPHGPAIGGSWSGFVQQHVVCRTVRDTALLLDVVAGAAPGEPYFAPAQEGSFAQQVERAPGRLRIAYSLDTLLGGITHPDVIDAMQFATELCAGLGHTVQPARPNLDPKVMAHAYLSTVAANIYADVERARAKNSGGTPGRVGDADLEAPTRLLYDIGRKASAGHFVQATHVAEQVGRTMAEFHRNHDIFMVPTIAVPPPRIGEFDLKRAERLALWVLRRVPLRRGLALALQQAARGMLEALPNTQPFNMSGQPAISLPLFETAAGLPIGVQFVAPYGREDVLIRLANQLQSAAPWKDRMPPMLAS